MCYESDDVWVSVIKQELREKSERQRRPMLSCAISPQVFAMLREESYDYTIRCSRKDARLRPLAMLSGIVQMLRDLR